MLAVDLSRQLLPGTFYLDDETVVARRLSMQRLRTIAMIIAAIPMIVAVVLVALMNRSAPV